MHKDEKFLSNKTEPFSLTSSSFVDEKAWKMIQRARLAFLCTEEMFSFPSVVRPEVAASWIRSRNMSVDANKSSISYRLSDEDFKKACTEYQFLINEANPVIGSIEEIDQANDYLFELMTCEGISLLQVGNFDYDTLIAERSVFNESTMGTNAHSLCVRYNTPFVIIGAEHYCSTLHDFIAISAPISNKEGTLIASLLLTSCLPDNPWSNEYRKLIFHAMGLITTMATTIESRANLRAAKTVLAHVGSKIQSVKNVSQHNQNTLETTLQTGQRIIVIIDSSALVERMSPEALRLLSLQPSAIYGKSIDELFYVGLAKELSESIVNKKAPEVTIGSQRYSIDANPIPGVEKDIHDGYVLTFSLVPAQDSKSLQSSEAKNPDGLITFEHILGSSCSLLSTVKLAKRYAVTMENVLIIGESGTGKEYFAQAVHNESRRNKPFISLNCAAIPAHLIESELFGYEAGSFTGADKKGSPGKIELAHGGTLFLDEIGDMPLDLQATLLRVLENKQVMRVGGRKYKHIDFRIIAATNRNLMDMVEKGTFRDDLLYRLSILTLIIPPLRSRKGERVFFAHHYLNECRRKTPNGPEKISPEALEIIDNYPWPGNVRQLKNAIFSAYYTSTTDRIEREDIPPYIAEFSRKNETLNSGLRPEFVPMLALQHPKGFSLHELEKSAIIFSLKQVEGNVAKAACLLQISKATLYRKIKEYGIDLRGK